MGVVFKCPPADLGKYERALLHHFKPAVTNGMLRGGLKIVSMLSASTKAMGAVDLGRVRDGWSYQQLTWDIGRVYNKAAHTVFVEGGRRRGARQPPTKALIPWVQRKLGVSRKDAKGLAFVIARKIKERGIKARPILHHPGYRRVLVQTMFEEVISFLDLALIAAIQGEL